MKIWRWTATLLALAVCGSACGTGAEASEVRGRVLDVPPGEARPVIAGELRFGLRMLDAWCARDPKANVVFSPSSLAGGLGMAALGAEGETAAEMAAVLGWPKDPLGGLKARSDVLRGLKEVRTSDQVWADEGLKAEQDYLDRVATGYGAGLKLLPLATDPEGSRKAVNDAISDDTEGMIKDLLPEGALDGVGWVLTDAIHLKAEWAQEFEPDKTATGAFSTAAGGRADAEFMNGTGDFGYARHGGWTGVRLPYAGGRLGMLALLPDGDGRECPEIDAGTVESFGSEAAGTRLEVSLPKVDLETGQEVGPLLQGLGMTTAFSDKADFTGISPSTDRISAVRHAAKLRVDEKGTEAAAATSVEMEVKSSAPEELPRVAFDRPYLLLLQDLSTGEPLFLARVADPSRK
ncbi:serpin family protein [Actinocorallia populi]|uniref:serpin family protein n=1 Tax=Actinocorallia populi TaxID=2079200 RepID=UPI000D08CC6D|nr:serpin family protein [Actinocorallia populi]